MSAISAGYKQTEVGVIPLDWDVEPLEYFTSFISYGFTNPMPTAESGVFMITAKDINQGKIQFNSARCTTEDAYRNLLTAKSRPRADDLLLTKDGTLGRLALVDHRTVCINQSVAILRPNSKVVPSFLKVLLETPAYQQRMIEDAGGSTIKHIYITIVNRMPVALPPTKAEQEAIAEALSDADALIESLEQLLTKKRYLKQAAMQELLTGKKRLPGFSGEWERVKAGSIGTFRGGSGFPTQLQGATDGEFPFFKVSDMNNEGNENFMEVAKNYINEATRKQLGANAFPRESIVFAKVGAAVFLERKKILLRASCLDNNMAAFILDAKRAYFRFVHFVLMNTSFGNLVSATALPSLNGSVLSEIELSLPPLPEQIAIANILSDMDSELAEFEAQLTKTRAIKQGMMQKLLTGEIRLI